MEKEVKPKITLVPRHSEVCQMVNRRDGKAVIALLFYMEPDKSDDPLALIMAPDGLISLAHALADILDAVENEPPKKALILDA